MTALEAYILARAYAKALVEGAGALKGAPCRIQSITPITGGNRITFAWETSEGETETDTLDVMDGADGSDGVGISSITYKETDVSGNYVYTVTLTDTNTYDITCPKGPQGETGETGATGNGIASIEKTGTAGLVDTYTITYTNGQSATFTVTNGESITVDSAMSGSSTNPVQNKVITEALALKQNATDDSLDTEAKTIVGAINEHEGDIGTLKSGLTNLDNEVNGDATTYPYADVITIEDAVPSNLAECNVKIEPVQDLHGYDHPWVGGGGKNLIDDGYSGNFDFELPAGTYYFKRFLTTSDANVNSRLQYFNGETYATVSDDASLDDGGIVVTGNMGWGANVSETIVTNKTYQFRVPSSVNELVPSKYHLMITTGSMPTSYAPYENICPITGHTEASVQRDGVNLFDVSAITSGYRIGSDGEPYQASTYCLSDWIKVKPSTEYVRNVAIQQSSTSLALYDKNKHFIERVASSNGTFTTTATTAYIRSAILLTDKDTCQLELGSTATPYEPYAGHTYTIALGDTIYGGSVDFKTGKVRVTHKYVDLSTLSFTLASGNRWATQPIADAKLVPDTQVANAYCSTLSIQSKNDITDNESLIGISVNYQAMFVARNGSDTDAPTGEFVYELATPTELTLTPAELELLKGQNTITASTGQISVTVNGVSGAIGELTADKQDKTDYSLNTTAKTVVEAINELNSVLTNVSGEVDTIKNGIVYGFHIDGSVSDPSNRVTYLRDAIGKTPAYMDYNEGSFNYGSWANAFFMPRPCMVERSGNVAYYLDPNDYTKKTDGTASDIADTTYAGNAMMEWGRDGKKIWMKIEPDSGDANSCNVYIADHRVDATYHDWSFHNCNGVSVDHFYTPIYNGSAVSDGTNNVLRSLSGQYISHTQNASTEITMAGRNNAGSAEIWGTEVYADIVLINMLLTLIGKSTNTQGVFGRGLDDGGENAMKAYVTGALNDKGLFFGYNDGSHGVKVFGMENWWACQWRRYRGHIMVDGVQKVKLTYGTEDGSTAAGYNLTGDNYISVGATPTGTSGQYCDKYEFSPNGAFPKDADNTKATASTHYCDGLWFNNSGTRVSYRGGASYHGSPDGAWCVDLSGAASGDWWGIGAALSCKPLA